MNIPLSHYLHSGIKAVLALSFARIFYRNSVDGAFLLPIEIEEDAYNGISEGDEIDIDISKNEIKNLTKNQTYKMKPFSEIIGKIIEGWWSFQLQTIGFEMGKTLFEKIWDAHVVVGKENGPSLIYIDRHLVHEVTSPQALMVLE